MQPPTSVRQNPTPRPPPPAHRPLSPFEEALALYKQGLYPEAEERLAAFPASNQVDIKAIVLLCRIRANQGKLSEARKLLEQAIAEDKLKAELHYLRAMILREQGALEEATASLKRALYLDQDMVLAHFSLANLALRLGKDNDARKHFENTLALLGSYRQDDILPESEGISAGRLTEIIKSISSMGDRNEEQKIRVR
jgi:chemotaxis protein methyltransferase CheR